ncbi:capsular biosynthesis protein [Helicobacter cholecystus]|uniref:Capsular biosynthesis protein n=2 Tax=Helicobacter cholecystus TaxID=45498 RepID=A0A3D8IXQ9_9HELI|nr:capsular biosynthesis protein [Helicobacter cholecystus]RDU70048.1 capsular biosynthesis protein [Helicobacter cholecystus]
MQKLLILTASDPASNPRPRRMIENLRGSYDLYAMGIHTKAIEGVKTFCFPAYTKRTKLQELRLYIDVFLCNWEKLIWTQNRLEIAPFLQEKEFDFIVCFDLPLLPIALKYKKNAKVIFDAQEYFPLWLTSSLRWRILFQRFNHFLCQTFLPQCDAVLSVSPSFVKKYAQNYGISPYLYLSLPYYYDIAPKPCDVNNIKILYHGSLSNNRGIDTLITLMQYLPSNFSLDLILVGGERKYREKILSLISKAQKQGVKISLLPPVPFDEIIPFGSKYDIGLYFMPPNTYNLRSTIPNKFFEYIGSSLALVITPNTDLVPIVREYNLGVVSEDFSIQSVAKALQSLSIEQINSYKLASYKAHKKLNNSQNQQKILSLLSALSSPSLKDL